MADGGAEGGGEEGACGGRGDGGEDGVDLLEESAGSGCSRCGRFGLGLVVVDVTGAVTVFFFRFVIAVSIATRFIRIVIFLPALLVIPFSIIAIVLLIPIPIRIPPPITGIQQPIRLIQNDQPHATQPHPPLDALHQPQRSRDQRVQPVLPPEFVRGRQPGIGFGKEDGMEFPRHVRRKAEDFPVELRGEFAGGGEEDGADVASEVGLRASGAVVGWGRWMGRWRFRAVKHVFGTLGQHQRRQDKRAGLPRSGRRASHDVPPFH
mmetsp:Transcript_15400/g.31337  ORF Transcript_15400/g.31337 Transcript_15400/m.31337 type:complete len:264 (+) Transcript_15400:433-1224(+)